ncbi:MAG: hypothetical protein FJ135_01840 [Deltaproteobacteria bacterium]|nr:hypothetical protein [Deltaproteobacteria bacterium]
MSVTLFKAFIQGMTDYIAQHNNNYSVIESSLNYILGVLTGQAGGDISVPPGLKEIFDREGIIGIGSYDFDEGTLTGPDYLLEVAGGAYWSGSAFYSRLEPLNLSFAGRSTGPYYIYIDSSGAPALSAAVQDTTIRSLHWDNATKVISSKQIYPGVAILFDGDDYADMLTSAARGKTYQKVADRLEDLETGQDAFAGYYAQDLPHSGLNFKYKAGKVRNDSVITDTPAGQVALTDNATNYVEVNPADGVVSKNTVGFTSGRIPLYLVATSGGAVTTVTDKRTAAIAGTGGGGGGHTQGTDTGTTATSFLVDSDASGSSTGRAGIEVENGDDPNAAVKFNRDSGKWEYTVDGGATWKSLGEADLSLAAQQFTRFVTQEDPPEVHNETGRGSSSSYETIDLSSYLGSPQFGVSAVLLRVFFKDSSPGINTGTLFKKGGGAFSPAVAFTVWSDESDAEPKPADLMIPLGDDETIEFFLTASGGDTADLQVFLLGWFETVYGVGTQEKTITQANINCPANSRVDLTFDAFCDRGLVHYLRVEETSGNPVNVYDIHLYADSGFSTLLYKAEGIVPGEDPFEDWLPFWVHDAGAQRQLRVRIINHDASHAGVFSLTIEAEQFA